MYFQKPVNFAELAAVIAERLSGSADSEFFHPQERSVLDGGQAAGDLSLLSAEKATEYIGSKDLYRMAATAFLKDSFTLLSATNKNRKDGNHRDALHNIHSLKGLAGTIGADRLFAELSRVNASMKDGTPLSSDDYRNLLSIMGVTVEAIEKYLES